MSLRILTGKVGRDGCAASAGDVASQEMPGWMRDHAANQAAQERQSTARARALRLGAAQAKLAAAKQRRQQASCAVRAEHVQNGM